MPPSLQDSCLASPQYPRAVPCVFLLLALPSLAFAQQPAADSEEPQVPTPATTSTDAADVPQVPGLSSPLRGWNAGLTITGVHSSSTAWATIPIPPLGSSFHHIFSLD